MAAGMAFPHGLSRGPGGITTCSRKGCMSPLPASPAASAFVGFLVSGRRLHATATFLLSVVLLSYPYFAAGADVSGRTVLLFGVLGLLGSCLGVMALATMRTRARHMS